MTTDRLVQRTLASLRDLRERAIGFEAAHAEAIAAIHPNWRPSASNLLHYLGIRQHDVRSLQQDLHALGLSSLGIIESHALEMLNVVIANLEAMAQVPSTVAPEAPVDFNRGRRLLHDHARLLFGPPPSDRSVRIMVTVPGSAATDRRLIEDLLRAGMDLMRINCAHDDPDTWRRMAENLRLARRRVGRHCSIQADLGGPKVRTGPVSPIGHFRRIKPVTDARGELLAPARVWLTPSESPEPGPTDVSTELPISGTAAASLQPDDRIVLRDQRGRSREMRLIERRGRSAIATVDRTVYAAAGGSIDVVRGAETIESGQIGELPAVSGAIRLEVGDVLQLTREALPGEPAERDGSGRVLRPAHIHCTLAAAFGRVRPGQRVWIDDGKIGGRVLAAGESDITIEVTHVPLGGGKLREEKGVNFPDTDLDIGALTDLDRSHLSEVVPYVDIVAMSFVRTAEDVLDLQDQLRTLGAGNVGVVLKVENAAAFRNLPRILLAALRSPPVGVMVARGDLAVEVGFERLSELQEEILWLCEAAHVPVIWATQVLEGLAKGGAPTRAEVSDAVMSSRAECVMLNKGSRIVGTVAFLADILARMEEHHDKRMALLRRLSVSEI